VTKAEFVQSVARTSGLSHRDAACAIDAILEAITAGLQTGNEISFTGFGKFSVRTATARQGVNPRTGERITIPVATVPRFRAASNLKAAVSGGGTVASSASAPRARASRRSSAKAARRTRRRGSSAGFGRWMALPAARIGSGGGGGGGGAAPEPRRRRKARPRTVAATDPVPPTERRINAWVQGRGGRRQAQLRPGDTYELKIDVGEDMGSRILEGDTAIDSSDLPEAGLPTGWILVSRSMRLEQTHGDPKVEVVRTGRGPWTAKFDLLVPKEGPSETRTVLVTPNKRSSGRIDVIVTVKAEIYRQLVIVLDVAGERPTRSGETARIQRDLVHAPAAHMGLHPPHEWTTPPGNLLVKAAGALAYVDGDAGALSLSETVPWFAAPAAVAGPIENVRAAAERFRGKWEDYLNAIDPTDLDQRLANFAPAWWGAPAAPKDRLLQTSWDGASRSKELRQLAAEGRILYDSFFPLGQSKLREWLDMLEPGHRVDFVWLDVDGGAAQVPWGLMYRGEIPPSGEPVDPTGFLAFHLRIGYISHYISAPSKALGNPDTTYCGNFLYWGDLAGDATGAEAARQRSELAAWNRQLVWPTPAVADPKAELLTALEAPMPAPVGVLYFFCQSSFGTRRDDPVLRFSDKLLDATAIGRTELGVSALDERPFVFANACTSAADDPYFANELQERFFKRGCRAFLGTETKVPIELAARFARTFFEFFYGRPGGAPIAAGEAVAQARLFLWQHYANIGGLFYTHVNQYELFMADDAEVKAFR
jgi:nucleoid DNA-binding protein